MRASHGSVWMVSLLLLGFLIVPSMASAQNPAIQFVSPAGSPRYVDTSDPVDPPIVIDVEVAFPLVGGGCAPPPPPVIPGTMVVKLQQLLDSTVEAADTIDTSGWTWTGTDSVSGQVTIDGNRYLYGINVCIGNGKGTACATKLIRVEHPVSEFVGRAVYFGHVTMFSQSPGGCLLPAGLEGAINNAFRTAPAFYISAPPAAYYPALNVDFQGLPLLGTVSFPAALDAGNNNVALGVDDLGDPDPVTITGIDLGPMNIPGYNCRIGGSADGAVYGEVSPNLDLDAQMRVFGITVGIGGGSGGCGLSTPAPTCNMVLTIDGNPTL